MVTPATAYIDESGQRSTTTKSSDHFVMSAVVIPAPDVALATTLLADMRRELRRGPNGEISWKKLKGHSDRVKAAQMLGQANTRISSVIVCKRDFDPGKGSMPDEDFAYLYTFRLLLERLSWLARDHGLVLSYTLAQIGRFSIHKLRRYESILRTLPDCSVVWSALDLRGGLIDQPTRLEYLQLADVAASATAQAFEPDAHGNVEPRYLAELRPSIYHRGSGKNSYTSYGMKMHPWNAWSRATHAWLASWQHAKKGARQPA